MADPVTIEEIDAELESITKDLGELDDEYRGRSFEEEAKGKWNDLNERRESLGKLKSELVTRSERLQKIAEDKPEQQEAGASFHTRTSAPRGEDIYDLTTVKRSWDSPSVEGDDLRDRAKRAIELASFPHQRANKEDMQGHVEQLVESLDSEDGKFSRYLLATGSAAYRRAFSKYLASESRTTFEEQLLQRAASLTTTAGGFAVPFVLDPTVIPTSSGAINPYREISDVRSITVDEWRGVSSDGITAAFQAEAAATTDNAPTLVQPTISTEMARAFVPFSIEIGQDWNAFSSEMAAMLQDSKDVLEATKFALGSGTNEPFGVITGATTVFTASNTNSLVVADIYGVHNALGPRFRQNAVWAMNNAVGDRIRQLDTAGGANLWVHDLQLRSAAVPVGMQGGQMGAGLLGKPAYEASAQSGTFTTGQLIAVIGDFGRYYKIIDRVGLSIEVIPHIFGVAQGNLPTGQRGLFAYWRVGAKVIHANAFRTLKLA